MKKMMMFIDVLSYCIQRQLQPFFLSVLHKGMFLRHIWKSENTIWMIRENNQLNQRVPL